MTNYSYSNIITIEGPMADVEYGIYNSQLNYMLNDKNRDELTFFLLERFFEIIIHSNK